MHYSVHSAQSKISFCPSASETFGHCGLVFKIYEIYRDWAFSEKGNDEDDDDLDDKISTNNLV